jgi:general secretion pathway protein D
MERVFCFAAVLALGVGAPAATIRIEPVSSVTAVGGTVDLTVQVTDVTDLYAFQFDLAFDPAVLSATLITEGAFLAGGGGTVFIPGTIDNALGTISFTAGTLLGPGPGVNGSGPLVGIQFEALSVGMSVLNLSNVVLLDSTSGDIAAGIENGSVGVVVPEPGSGWLISFPFVIGLLARRRRSNRKRKLVLRSFA